MGDHLARAQDFEGKAEKKLSGWGLFGSKFEDAADLFDKSANSFKLAKSCNLIFLQILRLIIINDLHVVLVKVSEFIRVSGDKAGSTYIKLANCHLKVTNSFRCFGVFCFYLIFFTCCDEFCCCSWKASMKLPKLMLTLRIAIKNLT